MKNGDLTQKFQQVCRAAQQVDIARQWTHPLYRYPASMSPRIARALVCALTEPGDTVLDPFCGGGTTAIEALAHGRLAVCSDLNNLACLITRSKAQPLTRREIDYLKEWLQCVALPSVVSRRIPAIPLVTNDGGAYAPRTHGLLMRLSDASERISTRKLRRVAQLMILRAGQVCFDCCQKRLAPSVLLDAFKRSASDVLQKLESYSQRCGEVEVAKREGRRLRVLCTDAKTLPSRLRTRARSISCVITSPPYPGVHVLYHRWQFRGRKEIELPYSIAGLSNGAPESHYTLGPRHEKGQTSYFGRLQRIFAKLNEALLRGTIVAQVVAFSHPSSQLRKYLAEMEAAGFEEVTVSGKGQPLVRRSVPNRRWYIRTGSTVSRKCEYVLLHRSTGGGTGRSATATGIRSTR